MENKHLTHRCLFCKDYSENTCSAQRRSDTDRSYPGKESCCLLADNSHAITQTHTLRLCAFIGYSPKRPHLLYGGRGIGTLN